VPHTWYGLITAGGIAVLLYGFGFLAFAADSHEKQIFRRLVCLFSIPRGMIRPRP